MIVRMTSIILSLAFIFNIPTNDPFGTIEQKGNIKETTSDNQNIVDIKSMNTSGLLIENKGQWDRSLLFVTDTTYGKIGFMRDGIIHYFVKTEETSKSKGTIYPSEVLMSDGSEHERMIDYCLVKLTFEDSSVKEVCGEDQVDTSFNYFLGNDTTKWVSNANGFRSVIYKDVWSGIDIKYYFKDGTLKYDIFLEPFVNPSMISMEVEGGEIVPIQENCLKIETPLGISIFDSELNTFYMDGTGQIGSSFDISGKRFSYELDCYDRSKSIVIDPHFHYNAMEYSSFIGGKGSDSISCMEQDYLGNIYIAGYTQSNDFPIISNGFDVNYNGHHDVFLMILDTQGLIISSTFIGGSEDEIPNYIDINNSLSILISGTTNSKNFPVTDDAYYREYHLNYSNPHSYDIYFLFLTEFGSKLEYSTYYGGNGSDNTGGALFYKNEYILLTDLTNHDINFSIFYKNNMKLKYSTTIIGSKTSMLYSMEIQGDDLYLCGQTFSTEFPTTVDAYQPKYSKDLDGFICVYDLSIKNITHSTYFGGNYYEFLNDMAFDEKGNVYICGQTYSTDFPTTKGVYDRTFNENADGFVLIIDGNLSRLINCTLFGGCGFEEPRVLKLDPDGNINVAGGISQHLNQNYFITEGSIDEVFDGAGSGSEAFYLKFNNNLSKILYSTFIGGSSGEFALGLMISQLDGKIIVAGDTESADFPVKQGSFDILHNGNNDVFFMKFNLTTSPTRPMNLTYIPDESRVDLFWNEPLSDGGSPVDRYRIIRGNSSDKLDIIVGETRERHFTDRSLINGRKYYYYVQAHNYIDYGTTSEIIMARPGTIPSPPMNFSVSEAGNNIIKLSWEPPLRDGGFDLLNYRLFKREGLEGQFKNITIDHRKNDYEDKAVLNGHFYEYYLSVTNELGESLPTPIINATPKTIPTYIQDLRSRSGSGFVLLKWSRPSYDGGSPIIDYTITRSDGTEVITKVIGSDNTEHNDTEVTNGMTYYYYIQSRNLAGYSYPSNDVIGSPKGVPDPPRSFELESSSMRVYLKWERPETDGGSPLNGYFVYKRNGLEEWERLSTTDAEATTCTDLSVVNGREYSYRVTAFNGIGESEPTQVLSATPLGLPGIPRDFGLVSGYGHVRSWWVQPDSDGGSHITGYSLYRQGPSMTDWDVIALSSTTLSYNDTTVVNGMMYRYRITSMTVVGEGPSSNILEAEPGSRPSPPSNIKIVPFDGYVKVTWDYPIEDGGFPIAKVTIYRGTGQGNREQVFRTDQKNGTYTDMGLTNGARYYYSLTAMNKLGESVHSEVVEITPFGRSTEPIMLRVVDKTTTTVNIGWEPPVDDGGSPILSYIIYRTKGKGIEEKVAEVDGDLTEYKDEGLKGDVTYSYSISAVNARGESIRSDPLEVTLSTEEGPISTVILLIVLSILILAVAGVVIFLRVKNRDGEETEE